MKLGAKWQLDAAMLSRPVDLTALVTMSQSDPKAFFEDDVMHLLVSKLLNSSNGSLSDKDTKLDVLTILGNLAALSERRYKEDVKTVLQGVSKWFDDYLYEEEVQPNSDDALEQGQGSLTETEPELHKAMFVLVARCYDYTLRTEDLLELTGGNRSLALEVIVSLLEEGETYTTELMQRQAPGSSVGPAQWEHQLVCMRHERPLILQMCRLLRGFTHPSTYFTGSRRLSESKTEAFDVLDFSAEMSSLLEITLRTELVEKLSVALQDCLYEDGPGPGPSRGPGDGCASLLCESDHLAVAAIHEFLQNLYHYAAQDTATFRTHILTETLLIPRLILPYLDRCAAHAELLCERAAESARDLDTGADGADPEDVREATALALEYPALARGIASSLRTLVIASFRAPPTRFVVGLLRRLNPTSSLLRAGAFVAHHDYLLTLVCLVNVNMGALDMSCQSGEGGAASKAPDGAEDAGAAEDPLLEGAGAGVAEAYYARTLLMQLRSVVGRLDEERRRRVVGRLQSSSALPVMRDTPSFAAIQGMLMSREELLAEAKAGADAAASEGAGAGEGAGGGEGALDGAVSFGETTHFQQSRSEAKAAAAARLSERGPKEKEEEAAPADRKFRLLGDLPPLEQRRAREPVNVELKLPELDGGAPKLNLRKARKKKGARRRDEAAAKPSGAPAVAPREVDGVPPEFACRINGHLMKDPVRTPAGLTFERETIVLWLRTRGSICPITGDPLAVDDLREDAQLRQAIMRWQISNLLRYNAEAAADATDGYADVYDF